MLNKLRGLFKTDKESAEQIYLRENHIQIDPELGFIVDGVVLNQWVDRLEYFSNRKLKNFDDLKELYFKAILINEKIDLEIASQRFVTRLGNNEENLLALKSAILKLNHYYRMFLRDQ